MREIVYNPALPGITLSVLVLCGSGARRKIEFSREKEKMLFQSLFSWMFRSKRAKRRVTCSGTAVSLLVLIDIAFEEMIVLRN